MGRFAGRCANAFRSHPPPGRARAEGEEMTGANSWIRWTPEEEKRLLNLIAAGKSWTLISCSLKRSMKSVKFHAKTLAQKDRQGLGQKGNDQ
jgi:DNA-binding NarL/FixJ family response regulator